MLDIDPHGMTARVMEKKISGLSPKDQVFVARNELPDPLPDNVTWFRAALDAVAERADLTACTEAVVLIPAGMSFFGTSACRFPARVKSPRFCRWNWPRICRKTSVYRISFLWISDL